MLFFPTILVALPAELVLFGLTGTATSIADTNSEVTNGKSCRILSETHRLPEPEIGQI